MGASPKLDPEAIALAHKAMMRRMIQESSLADVYLLADEVSHELARSAEGSVAADARISVEGSLANALRTMLRSVSLFQILVALQDVCCDRGKLVNLKPTPLERRWRSVGKALDRAVNASLINKV
jgi:hypothetical protein